MNHKVGLTRFKLDAAEAIGQMEPDVAVITEYYPGSSHDAFREVLQSYGLFRHVVSGEDGSGANRVLIAARDWLDPLPIELPDFDIHAPSNVAAAMLRKSRVAIVGVRVPWYDGAEKPLVHRTWEWLEVVASSLRAQPAIIAGDLNVSLKSRPARGGAHFKRILESGWTHAAPGGSTFGSGPDNQIDHILATDSCEVGASKIITQVRGLSLCGTASSLSDHAAIEAEISRRDGGDRNDFLYELDDD